MDILDTQSAYVSYYGPRSYGDRLVVTTSAILPTAILIGLSSYLLMKWLDSEYCKSRKGLFISITFMLTLVAVLVSTGFSRWSKGINFGYSAICVGLFFPVALMLLTGRFAKTHRIVLAAISFIVLYSISLNLIVETNFHCDVTYNPLRIILRYFGITFVEAPP